MDFKANILGLESALATLFSTALICSSQTMNLKTQVHMPKPTMITSLINPESPGDHNEGWFSPVWRTGSCLWVPQGMARQDPVPFPSTHLTHQAWGRFTSYPADHRCCKSSSVSQFRRLDCGKADFLKRLFFDYFLGLPSTWIWSPQPDHLDPFGPLVHWADSSPKILTRLKPEDCITAMCPSSLGSALKVLLDFLWGITPYISDISSRITEAMIPS